MNFENYLNKYAELIVEIGVNLQKNQPLVINSPIECADFARKITKYAYKKGAKIVHVEWNDEQISLMKYLNSPIEIFEKFPKWKVDCLEDFAEGGAAFISISASDPELLKDVDENKISTYQKTASKALKRYMEYTMNNEVAWCVVSVPTKKWAEKVFPNISEELAVEKLWKAIFNSVRIDDGSPIESWNNHLNTLNDKVNFLNEKRFKKLHYTSKDTDLIIELPKNHLWQGGGEKNQKDVYFVANMPTEEVFTMPLKTGVNGTVKSTKPLNYGGKLITDFSLTFKDGKVIDFSAKQGYETLKKLIETDEGSHYLGEVALVPYDSPISNSNILFYNTLFDENASCHLAFGKAYPTCLKGGEEMSIEELEKNDVNDSLTHIDFMIGSKDLNILGETFNGEKLQVFKDGNWAF